MKSGLDHVMWSAQQYVKSMNVKKQRFDVCLWTEDYLRYYQELYQDQERKSRLV